MPVQRFQTISAFHRFQQLPAPEHPLFSVIRLEATDVPAPSEPLSWSYDFYCIALKSIANPAVLRLKYGWQPYDFEAGVMSFVAPHQVLSLAAAPDAPRQYVIQSGWMVLIHPDFLWDTTLASSLRAYDFWSYSVREALFLAEKEQVLLGTLLEIIRQEQSLDKFSKPIVVAHLEALFHYADRFYHRQFLTREKSHHELLARLNQLLLDYFKDNSITASALPTVRHLSDRLHVSPAYLRRVLKLQTGRNTQQHIHEMLIERAKEQLATTALSVSEVAYALGFEHVQSFSKLFKSKTSVSPVAFRQSLN